MLLEELTGSQLVKKFPAFHVNGRFITAFMSFIGSPYPILSEIHEVHPPHTTYPLFLLLGLPSVLFHSGFPIKTLYTLKNKILLDVTYYFIMLMLCSTCFGHHYANHQELTTIALVTTWAVWFLSCCWLGVRFRQDG